MAMDMDNWAELIHRLTLNGWVKIDFSDVYFGSNPWTDKKGENSLKNYVWEIQSSSYQKIGMEVQSRIKPFEMWLRTLDGYNDDRRFLIR